jgi:hypothetical protein
MVSLTQLVYFHEVLTWNGMILVYQLNKGLTLKYRSSLLVDSNSVMAKIKFNNTEGNLYFSRKDRR